MDKKIEAILKGNDRVLHGAEKAAEFTGYKPGWVFQMTAAVPPQIPHYKINHRLIFLESELIAWMLSGRRKTQAELQAEAKKRQAR